METAYSKLREKLRALIKPTRISITLVVTMTAIVMLLSAAILTVTFETPSVTSIICDQSPQPVEKQTNTSDTVPEPQNLAPIPGGRGSRAAPGFNFSGVCGQQNFKCVISYVIWGENPKYITGALRNAMLAKDVYPGWIPRFYFDEATVKKSILQQLENLGAELIPISSMHGVSGMMTRFLVADDDTVDRYIVRDADSRLNLREKAAVDEWIKSGYSIHVLRDHPSHKREMNGGMWGGVKGAAGNLAQIMKSNQMDYTSYNADQDFLGRYVYPPNQNDQIAHDSAACEEFPNSFSFPTNRIGYEHVGQVFSESDEPRWGDINCCLLNWEAPLKCRRHPEWTKG